MHCEDGSCDLGYFECECPKCNKEFTEYDAYMSKDEMISGEVYKLNCPKCKSELFIKYYDDENDWGYYLEKK